MSPSLCSRANTSAMSSSAMVGAPRLCWLGHASVCCRALVRGCCRAHVRGPTCHGILRAKMGWGLTIAGLQRRDFSAAGGGRRVRAAEGAAGAARRRAGRPAGPSASGRYRAPCPARVSASHASCAHAPPCAATARSAPRARSAPKSAETSGASVAARSESRS